MLKIPFKLLHPEAEPPTRAFETDAGFDITATDLRYDADLDVWVYSTDLAVSIPPGYVGLLFPRSSARKYSQILANCVGVIDAGYTGEITFSFRFLGGEQTYEPGDRIGQLVIQKLPEVCFEQVEVLPETARGTQGHGSTGN